MEEEDEDTFLFLVFFLLVGESLVEEPGEEEREEEPLLAGLVWAGPTWRKVVWFSRATGWLIWTNIVPPTVWTIWYIGWTWGGLTITWAARGWWAAGLRPLRVW